MIKRVFLISTITMLVLASFVIAAGTSTRDKVTNRDAPTNTDKINCDSKDELKDRIRCRLENPKLAAAEAYSAVEEACKDQDKQETCMRLYKASARCYEMQDSNLKKRCFLKESGVNFNSGGTFRAAPNEAKRNYVVLLLYELQERIEKMQEEGKITTEQATSLIEKIVEIKRMILAEEKRADIVVKINEFKREYKSVVLGIGSINRNNNNSTNNNNTVVNGTITNNTIINNNTGGNSS